MDDCSIYFHSNLLASTDNRLNLLENHCKDKSLLSDYSIETFKRLFSNKIYKLFNLNNSN